MVAEGRMVAKRNEGEGEKERRSVSRDDPPLRDNDVSFKLLCSKLL